nr:MAG TPA: hypothetical protein [Caudoviricetes sp.]
MVTIIRLNSDLIVLWHSRMKFEFVKIRKPSAPFYSPKYDYIIE